MKLFDLDLTFRDLSYYNKERCEKHFHPINEWSETDWATAVAGETGEMCNWIKKRKRGEDISVEEVGKELADIIIYCDLMATRLNISLEEFIINKFNEVSNKINSSIKL